MVYRKSLKNREYGFEFSGTEHSLIFEHDNMGFVRFDGRSKRIFHLDPSPFLPSPKREIYLLETCIQPEEGELIKVKSVETENVIQGKFGNFTNTKINYVRDWEKVSPNKLIHRKTLHPEEFIDFFKLPFIGISDDVEPIAHCLALYSASSPLIGANNKGGIDTAMITRKHQWSAFKRLMTLIPNEFKKTNANYFYGIMEKEKKTNPLKSSEVSLAFQNPTELFVQIPVTLNVELKPAEFYKENVDFQAPMMRSHLLDILLFQPKISSKIDSYLTESIYDMVDTVASAGIMPYKQDLGSASSKLSSAFARLNFEDNVTKESIKESKSIWEDMFVRSQKMNTSNLSVDKQLKLSFDAQNLYSILEDVFGIEVMIPIEDIPKHTKFKKWTLDDAITELRLRGAIYSPNNEHIKLMDLKK